MTNEIEIIRALLGGVALLCLFGAGRGNTRGIPAFRSTRELMGLPLSAHEMERRGRVTPLGNRAGDSGDAHRPPNASSPTPQDHGSV